MTLNDDFIRAQVERLRLISGMTARFHAAPKARMLWGRHYHRINPYPDTFVTASNGASTIEGLVIDGDWDPKAGWDFDSRFTLFTEDGEILHCNGWMAEDLEVL